MDTIVSQTAAYLWNQSRQIALLIAVVAALTWLLRGRSAHLRYLLWLLVLAKCLVPPAFNVALPILPQAAQLPTASPYEPLPTGPVERIGLDMTPAAPSDLDGPVDSATPAAGLFGNLSMPEAVVLLWLTGMSLLLAVAMVKAVRTRCWLQRRRSELPGRLQADIDALLDSFGVRWRPKAWLMEDIGQPFVWGLVRGDIHLPASLAAIGDDQHRRNILAHELSHVLRFDAAVNLLQVLAQAAFWFHPLVWWANRRIRAEREKSCDEMAIARLGTRPRDYGRAILETLLNEHRTWRPVPSLAVAGPVKNIEERIKTMLRPGKRFYRRPSLLAAACALLLALFIVPTTLALTNRPADKAKTEAKQTEIAGESEPIQAQRLLSATRLKQVGLSLHLYATDHEEKYPDEWNALTPYFSRDRVDELASFLSNDVEYLAAGKTRPENDAWDVPLAYDLTLLRNDEGTNVVFADGHVQFVTGAQLDKYGITLPRSHLEILDVRFEPVHQGKNVVHVTVRNTSDKEQVFATHIYTRSPDYGQRGVGWGTPFSDTIRPQEKKPVRFVFKIQGPVTDRTYVNLRFYNPETQDSYEHKRYFEQRRYTSAELPKAPPEQGVRKPASPAQAQAVTQAFNQIQGYLRDKQYEQAWGRFSKDFREAEYQKFGLETFRRAMEPTHPMHSAFTWEREDFLNLKPGPVFTTDGKLVLTAVTDGQTWTVDFVRADNQWQVDWIAGYVPAILRIQREESPAPAGGSGNVTMPDESPASKDKASNLKVLEVQFEPVQQGKNVLRIQVQNVAGQDQVFGVSVQAHSPGVGGWGTTFLDTIKAGRTQWTRCAFTLRGPLLDSSDVELSFYNPGPAPGFDAERWFATKPWDQWFRQRTYTGRELPRKEAASARLSAAPQEQSQAVRETFRTIQDHVARGKYESAWDCFTKDYQDAGFFRKYPSFKECMEEAKGPNRFSWLRGEFAKLTPESVAIRDGTLVLTAALEQQKWTIDFVQEDGRWKMDWVAGFVPGWERKVRWEEYVLPKMEKRSTTHFDIYYPKDSTAAREIEQIAQHKDKGFAEICRFLGRDSAIRIRLVFFEDGQSKQQATGHQGAGWAYGNTIVEVYNEKEKLDSYHETTHILMGPFGNPPALFNEGFAVYMSEWLGAPALESLGGGQATIHQRAKELKDKGDGIDLPELLSFTEIGSARTRPPVAYAEAGSFVKFLIDNYGKDKFLQGYAALQNSDAPAVQQENAKKLGAIFGKPVAELEEQWKKLLSAPASSASPQHK